MTQYQVTVNDEILHHLFSGNDEELKELLTQVLDQILEYQRSGQALVLALMEMVVNEVSTRKVAKITEDYSEAARKAIAVLEEGFEDSVAVLNLPERYRKRFGTNSIEHLNQDRYFNMDEYWEWKKQQKDELKVAISL